MEVKSGLRGAICFLNWWLLSFSSLKPCEYKYKHVCMCVCDFHDMLLRIFLKDTCRTFLTLKQIYVKSILASYITERTIIIWWLSPI